MADACAAAAAAFARAQTAWLAFYNGDFVSEAPKAEANLGVAKHELSIADRDGAACAHDRQALPRRKLHFEIDVVDARRSGGATSALQRVAQDLAALRNLGLARTSPAQYEADVQRLRELQAETRGTLVIPAPAASTLPGSCAGVATAPHPIAPILPAVPPQTALHRGHGTTAVTVIVAPSGSVLSTLTTQSSGDPVLDAAVESAARMTPFAPGEVDCRPVQGEYRFTYSFPRF